jgi:uncharacterized protein YjbI with pentapeptide repeats
MYLGDGLTASMKPGSTASKNWLLRLWLWLGLTDKSPWDFVQLLILPALFVVLGYFLNEAANERQRHEVAARFQQGVIKDYYDVITNLVLEKNLINSKAGQPFSDVAKAYTFNVLETVDGSKKRGIMLFLNSLQLLKINNPIIFFEVGSVVGRYKFKRVGFAEADLSGMQLLNVRLAYADFQKTNFKDAIIFGCMLNFADLTGANLKETNLMQTNLSNTLMTEADLSGSNLIGAKLEGCLLSGAILKDALYSKTTVWPEGFDPDSHGAICICPDENLQKAVLNNKFLRGVDLRKADLSGADLQGAQLLKAKLNNAILKDASLQGSYLQEADLRGAHLEGANLKGAEIEGAVFENAVYCKTIMPDGSVNNEGCR